MATVLRIIPIVIFLILPISSVFAQAPRWVQGLHSRVRLITGGVEDNRLLAGVEIALDPGFKTYWRTPGESGLPPRFDWSGSQNVDSVEIRWPAPTRYEDAGGVAFAYSHDVVLPVLVKAKEPGKPVTLVLALDYGICKDICIPAHAEMTTALTGDDQDRAVLENAMTAVPRLQALGAEGALSVVGVEPVAPGQAAVTVTVRAPAGSQPTLFAEGPENWYLSTSYPADGGRFTVTVEDKPKDASGPVPLRLTLVAGDAAVETEVRLDASLPPR